MIFCAIQVKRKKKTEYVDIHVTILEDFPELCESNGDEHLNFKDEYLA